VSELTVRSANRVGIVAGLALAISLCVGLASASAAKPRAFRWLVPAPAPAGWKHASPPTRDAVLAYPPSLSLIHGDSASVSVAKRDKTGRVLVYLNSTPREGAETLTNWLRFRIEHDQGESTAVHKDAGAVGLPFLDGVGSCVIDHYITRYHANHYREIACYVQGPTRASVVVAAALESEWTRALPMLERAISAYRPR
jgi:hypothetical protein